MARAAASVEDLELGTLPPVCAKTGDTADGFATLEFTSTPSWTWILLLFGIIPFLIAQYFSRSRVLARVPMSNRALRRADLYTWFYRGGFLLGAIELVTTLATSSSSLATAGLVTLILTLLFMAFGWPFVWPTGRVSEGWVWLSFVHERFARELDRRYRGRA